MDIVHLGHASFKIRGKKATLVTDPFDPEVVGFKFPKTEAEIVTVSHQHRDHNFVSAVSGDFVVVSGPGEYEIRGVKISGIPAFHDDKDGQVRGKNTIFRIEMDGITLVHLGDLGHKLNDQITEKLDAVDVLMIPVGGYYTIDPSLASQIITALEPSIIIPMHYSTANMNKELAAKIADVSVFLKEIGKEKTVPMPKLTVTKDRIGTEPEVFVLEQ